MINLKKVRQVCSKYKISFEQFIILLLLKEGEKSNNREIREYILYQDSQTFNKSFNDLIDKGYIIKVPLKNKSSYLLTDEFKKDFYTKGLFASEEFWAIYPSTSKIDNKYITLKNVDKEVFLSLYYEKVGQYSDLHKEVIVLVDYAKKNLNYGFPKIDSFIKSENWVALREIVEENRKDKIKGNNVGGKAL